MVAVELAVPEPDSTGLDSAAAAESVQDDNFLEELGRDDSRLPAEPVVPDGPAGSLVGVPDSGGSLAGPGSPAELGRPAAEPVRDGNQVDILAGIGTASEKMRS